jgi:membrane-associated phospholipid phosphatase
MRKLRSIYHTILTGPMLLKLGLSFVVFLMLSIGFVAIADEVTEGETLAFDQAVLEAIYARSSEFWNQFFLVVTELGGVAGVIVLTAGLLAALLYKKNYRYVVLVVAGVGGAALLNVLLKLIFERARPDLWEQLIVETSFSFPSGHAMASAALALCFVAVFWRSKYRLAAMSGATLYVLLIGFSRLYLGVHYPTDIIGGWLISSIWVLLVISVMYGWGIYRRAVPIESLSK